MLAHLRRWDADPGGCPREPGQRPDLRRCPQGGIVDLDRPLQVRQERVVDELLGRQEAVGGDVLLREDIHPFVQRPLQHPLEDQVPQGEGVLFPFEDERRPLEPGVVVDGFQADGLHPVREQPQRHARHLEPLAVLAPDRQVRNVELAKHACPYPSLVWLREQPPGDLQRQGAAEIECRIALEQAGLDPLPEACLEAGPEGRRDALHCQVGRAVAGHGPHPVGRRCAVHHSLELDVPTRCCLDDSLIHRQAGIWPRGPHGCYGAVDQAGVGLGQRLVVEAVGAGCARRKRFDKDIHLPREGPYLRLPFRRVQVQNDARLTPVPHGPRRHRTVRVPTRRLDFDDLSPVVGQQHGGKTARHALADVQSSNAVEYRGHRTLPPPPTPRRLAS